jgi:nucleotide-binding universal stress UspA family protein
MYQTVLLPTDGSESMARVVDNAAGIAAAHDATVHVLYVVDDRAFLTLQDDMKADVVTELEGEGEVAVEAAVDRLESAGVEVVTAVRQGSPAEEILAYVDEVDADVVAMGTHGDDYHRTIVGSVSREVVARSPVPVLTVTVADTDADG